MDAPPNHVVRLSIEDGTAIMAHPDRCSGPLGCGLIAWLAAGRWATPTMLLGGLAAPETEPQPEPGRPRLYEVIPEATVLGGAWRLVAIGG